MGKPTGFLELERQGLEYRDPKERIRDFRQVALPGVERVRIDVLSLERFQHGIAREQRDFALR